MRILFIIPALSKGGAERQMVLLAQQFAEHDHEVHLAYFYEGPNPEYQRLNRIFLWPVHTAGNYDPRILWTLVGKTRRLKPDIVQTCIVLTDILGGLAALICKTPWILREPSSQADRLVRLKESLRNRLGRRASAIIANSLGGRECWARSAPNVPIHVIRNGIDIAACLSSHGLGSSIPPLEPGTRILLYVGRLHKNKNVCILIQSLARLVNRVRVVLLVCGEGPEISSLKAICQRLGLEKSVYFLGFRSGPICWEWMKRASLFINLSNYEGTPNAVLEAMACRCPLVVSDIPAHREFLNEQMAYFVKDISVEATVSSLTLALANAEASQRQAHQAAQFVESLSLNKMYNQYRVVYERLIKPR